MSIITGDSLGTYGGALQNLSPVVNSSTDMDAAAGNAAMAAVSGMSNTRIAAWVRMTMNGGAAPTLVAWRAIWRAASPTAPVLAYSGTTGLFSLTWPTTVQDEIPFTAPGYSGPQSLNLLDGWCNVHMLSGGSPVMGFVTIASPNVANIVFVTPSTGAQVNPSGVDAGVWLI